MTSDIVLSVMFAVIGTFFYASSTILVRAGITRAKPVTAMLVSLTANLVILWVIVLLFVDVSVDFWAWRYFILAGFLAPGLARLCNYEGIDRVGVNVTSPIVYAYPLVSVSLAIAVLGERLSLIGLTGGLVAIAGGVAVGSAEGDGPRTFDRQSLVFPVAASAFYGISQVFRKVGIDHVGSPLLAAAVTITTSWILASIYVLWADVDLSVQRRELTYFAASGVASSVAIPVVYLAFQIGYVVVVTPVTNLAPAIVLFLSYLFFRTEEPFTPRVIAGTILLVVGITVLTISGSVL